MVGASNTGAYAHINRDAWALHSERQREETWGGRKAGKQNGDRGEGDIYAKIRARKTKCKEKNAPKMKEYASKATCKGNAALNERKGTSREGELQRKSAPQK